MRPLTLAVLLSPLLFSAPLAHAAQPGTCGTPEAIGAELKAEGQHSIAFAAAPFYGGLHEAHPDGELMFTADRDGGTGYILEANQPPGAKADKACIVSRIDGVKLFDPKSAEFPKTAMMQGSDATAAAECETMSRKTGQMQDMQCGFFNTMVQPFIARGERVLMQGRASNQVITVTMNILVKSISQGAIFYTMPSTGSTVARNFKEAQQTEAGLQLARK
ncbi:hypothetical protein [Caballeronia sp. AZ7_KS35]|uniref:hypothetical protein n=1 Tax=Caballeronia sp. AZ7_KS35 TaxID=2921762 RepID=UPI00202865A7|nr:hypothetical protein [Caballeronia sp. AZ7_KS35]